MSVGICERVCHFVSSVPLPKEVVLVNFRLGLCYRVLQVIMIALGLILVSFNNVTKFQPTSTQVDFYRQDADALENSEAEPNHCTTLGAYAYVYSGSFQYKPTSCEPVETGEDYLKTADGAFFATLSQDTLDIVREGDECNAEDGLEFYCQPLGGRYSKKRVNGLETCKCSLVQEYFVKNQERTKFFVRHSYTVQNSWDGSSMQSGSSSKPFYSTGTQRKMTQHRGKLLTRILKSDGSTCDLGGKHDFLPEDGDIGGTIEDWLACADLTLDTRSEETQQWTQDSDSTPPHLRVTGVKISLELSYMNYHAAVQGDVVSVCELRVSALPAWNSRFSTDYSVFRDPITQNTEERHRRRHAQGISFSFKQGGSFRIFDPGVLLSAVVNAIVVITIPTVIIRFMALHCIGVVSHIYTSVLRKPFCIFQEFHGLSARMMLASEGFKALTKQWGREVEKLKPIRRSDVMQHMMDIFQRERGMLKADGTPLVEDREILELASVVIAGLDTGGDGEVVYDEFVSACASHEYLDPETMIQFFDKERRLAILEQIFDPTRSQISSLHDTLSGLGRQPSLLKPVTKPPSPSNGAGGSPGALGLASAGAVRERQLAQSAMAQRTPAERQRALEADRLANAPGLAAPPPPTGTQALLASEVQATIVDADSEADAVQLQVRPVEQEKQQAQQQQQQNSAVRPLSGQVRQVSDGDPDPAWTAPPPQGQLPSNSPRSQRTGDSQPEQ